MSEESLLEFPCDFPLKIMGLDQPDFRGQVEQIVTSHAGEAEATFRPSRDGKYVSISYTLRIESREQLDALYRELSTTDEVLFVL